MTIEQIKKFMEAIETAEICSYEFDVDSGARITHNGETCIARPDYDNEVVVGFRGQSYYGSVPGWKGNVETIVGRMEDIHNVRTAGDYDQIKKFVSVFGAEFTDDDFKVLLNIDKKRVQLEPATGDYNRFRYLGKKEYDMLTPEAKEEYDAAKEAYEKARRDYIAPNQAARVDI